MTLPRRQLIGMYHCPTLTDARNLRRRLICRGAKPLDIKQEANRLLVFGIPEKDYVIPIIYQKQK